MTQPERNAVQQRMLAPIGGPAHGRLRPMNVERFEALSLWGRDARLRADTQCASAWSTPDEAILIGVFHYLETREFLCICFVRDPAGRYGASQRSGMLPSLRAGDLALQRNLGAELLDAPGGISGKAPPEGMNLFAQIDARHRLHPVFELLRDGFSHRAAREMLEVLGRWIPDRDGNFVKDFQTSGFSARIWELCLWAAFMALDFDIDPECAVPDFLLRKGTAKVFVEATTANGLDTFAAAMGKGPPPPPPADLMAYLEHDMPQRFGSPLFSKLKRRYWTKPHVAGNPLVLAIADFHSPGSMLWSRSALPMYLYGFGIEFEVGEDGAPSATAKALFEHVVGDKTVPANFFAQPEAENISAVLFSSGGTISKFNRMGARAGFGDPWVSLVRSGVTIAGEAFKIDVEAPAYQEGWADELTMFHNPRALHPVDPDLFPIITHVRMVEGELLSISPAARPSWGQTTIYDFLGRKDGIPPGW